MSRLAIALVCASLLASACKVQRTPPEYIDHTDPIAVVRDAAAEELQDRVLAMGQALNRGDVAEALRTLAPSADGYLVAPGGEAIATGDEQIAGVLGELATLRGPVRLRDVQVAVGPRANVAWFRAEAVSPEEANLAPFRITGIFLRGDEGEWRLVQGHISAPTAPDSLAPSPASAATPPADG